MKKQKLKISSEVLNKVTVEFLETKQFTEKHLEQSCLTENISVEEVIQFLCTSLEAKSQRRKTPFTVQYFLELHLSIKLHLTKYVNRYNIQLNLLGYDTYLAIGQCRRQLTFGFFVSVTIEYQPEDNDAFSLVTCIFFYLLCRGHQRTLQDEEGCGQNCRS